MSFEDRAVAEDAARELGAWSAGGVMSRAGLCPDADADADANADADADADANADADADANER